MFKAVFSQAATWKKIIKSLTGFIETFEIKVNTKDGMKIEAFDGSHVAYVRVQLFSTEIESFYCKTPTVIGISIKSLTKIMDLSNEHDVMAISYGENEDTLNIQFDNPKKEKLTEIALKLIDINSDTTMAVPDYDHDIKITMTSKELTSTLEKLKKCGEAVELKVVNNNIVEVNDEDEKKEKKVEDKDIKHNNSIDNKEKTITKKRDQPLHDNKKETTTAVKKKIKSSNRIEMKVIDDSSLTTLRLRERPFTDEKNKTYHVDSPPIIIESKINELSQTYSLKYLCMFAKAGSLSDLVHVFLKDNMPMKIRFDIDSVDLEGNEKASIGYIEFLLASKLSSDEEEKGNST